MQKTATPLNQENKAIQPNVLFVTVDQWAAGMFGHAGHPVIQTPTIDQLVRLGTRYSNAYSESPICIPARRTIMTGQTPRSHGDRSFMPAEPMPRQPLLAQCFRDAGYQATAIGKLHVFPQRDRIGFDDTLLAEEGRPQLGAVDDYDIFLSDQGHTGQQFMHGMSNNDYQTRPWHLPESLHVTNWITRTAALSIKRRDPTRPAFWHVSYSHPHPPLVPLSDYLDMYRDVEIDLPMSGTWAEKTDELPSALRVVRNYWPATHGPEQHRALRRAYYALCTQIDHQLRILMGTLREENLLDNTIIMLTADHGDMLGQHGLWAKTLFYEGSANVPMILVGTAGCERIQPDALDHRLIGLQDIMPTLLDLAAIPIPTSVEGMSMVGEKKRDTFFGECGEGRNATRMLRDNRYKLIWYPANHCIQLFDLENDPQEMTDLSKVDAYKDVRAKLEAALVKELYGTDLDWLEAGRLAGYDPGPFHAKPNRALAGQRGLHYPPPPVDDPNRSANRPAA